MRMLDAYKAVLKEIDKFESPVQDPDDFTYFFRSTIDEYIKENYEQGDVLMKDLDDIRVLLSDPNHELTQDVTDKSKFTLPVDYLHPLGVEILAKVVPLKYRRWKKDDVERFELKRQRSNKKGLGVRNPYEAPSEENPQFRIVDNSIYALIGENFVPTKLFLWYIKKENTVTLGPEDSDYNEEAYNTTLQFPNTVCYELIKRCKVMILENSESERLSTSMSLQQLNKD